jgi:electron transfer flavoprotein alpha subunit
MSDYQGVLAYCELVDGKLAPIASELLGGGKKLAAELGQSLTAVVVGSGVADAAKEAGACGADKVYVVDDALLADYQSDSYVTAMEKVVAEAKPQIILMGQTAIGRDLAPLLAFKLDTAATLDCLELAIDASSKRLLQTKPVYGGNALAVYTTETNPQIVTVRIKSMEAAAKDDGKQAEIVTVDAGLDAGAIRTKVLDHVKEEIEGIKLEDAATIVSGGRGIGSPDGFKQLQELASTLDAAAIGASRPPCDNGWVPAGLQIGLTGKVVAPELYIAIAISGASQHMSGCSGAKTIVAINKDAEANIIKRASYAVVGDWKKVLPAFTAKVKELR